MNDFTKEELLIIKDAIRIYLRTPSPIEAEHLRDKIQSMIDNYSEQKSIWIVTGHDGLDMHIEKVFSTEEQAINYKEELNFKCNEDHEDYEYVFSVHERRIEK